MASISINPTSNSFTTDGGSGTIGVTVETANWSSTPTDDAVWMAMRKRTNLTWSSWSIIKIKGEDGEDGLPGDDGRGISSTNIYYAVDTQGTSWSSIPSSAWVPASQGRVPSANPGDYLWTRIEYVYTYGSPSYSYSVTRWGEDGDSGTASKSPTMIYSGYYHINPHNGEADTEISYWGSEDLISVVYHGGQYYKARPTAGTNNGMFTDSASSPANSSNWIRFGASFDSIATGLIFAQEATIEKAVVRKLHTNDSLSKRVMIEGDTISMYDSSNRQKMLVTGENLGDLNTTSPTYSFSAKSATASSSGSSVSQTFSLWTPNIATTANTVSLPQLTVRIRRDSTLEETISAVASYLIDGEAVSSVSLEGQLTYDSTIDLTLPSRNITLPTGSHSIQLHLEAETDTTSLSSIATTSGGTITIVYATQAVEIGANGFRAAFDTTHYAEFAQNTSDGKVYLALRAGDYGLRISDSGIEKWDDDWTPISL